MMTGRAANVEQEQEPVVAWLGGGGPWGTSGQVEQIQTHAARIFLARRRAYKMKRAVCFSFLDFRTLAQRRGALQAELRLNRRTAPMLYRRLLPVTRARGGGFELDGQGEPVEWLLEMTRFEADERLDRIAARGPLADPLIDGLADAVGDLHDLAAVRRARSGFEPMAEVVRGNRSDLEQLVDRLPGGRVRRLVELTAAELARRRSLLDRRAAEGRVRHGHGDLHAANIVVLKGRPVLFDCLEFDPELATTDVLYDLAFLLMDLLHRDQPGAARRLLSLYLERTMDDAGIALLPLFLAVRATVRAKIEGFQAADDPVHVAQATAYLDQALAFLEHRPVPRLVAVGGLSGTGKSLARALAGELGPAPGAVVVRSDGTRKRLAGRKPTERLGPEAYSDEVTERVFERIARRAETLLRGGHSVIADAVYLRPEQRAQIERAARSAGAPFVGLWLQADRGLMAERIGARAGDASDATLEVVLSQLDRDPGPIAWTRLDASGSQDDLARRGARLVTRG